MEHYDFAVLKGDKTIATQKSIALPDSRAAWPQVVELAKKHDEPGCRIRVTNKDGDVVILVGIAAARRFIDDAAAA